MLIEIGQSETGELCAKFLAAQLPRRGTFEALEEEIHDRRRLWVGRDEDLNHAAFAGNVHAVHPAVADIIRHAEAVFIAGGNQARYVEFWKGTPVQDAINANIASGKPIGGTSAGLAVLGEFAYGCLKDKEDDNDLASTDVLPNPYHERVTLVRDFLQVPNLQNTLTDSHFAKRDRMGRTLGFLARLVQDGWSKAPREVAIDEKSAVLVEADGRGTVVGSGHGAYFLQVKSAPEVCRPNTPLTIHNISVYRAPAGAHFDFKSWTGDGGDAYTISVENGVIRTTRPDNVVY